MERDPPLVLWSSEEQPDRLLAWAIIYTACAVTGTLLWGLA